MNLTPAQKAALGRAFIVFVVAVAAVFGIDFSLVNLGVPSGG
jgi:hypothetical protein